MREIMVAAVAASLGALACFLVMRRSKREELQSNAATMAAALTQASELIKPPLPEEAVHVLEASR